MKLIIDIPESMYEGVMIDRVLDTTVIRILNAIKYGTPLPKGHGRLIDADDIALIDEQFYVPSDYYVAESAINDAPTIIEADKESEDTEYSERNNITMKHTCWNCNHRHDMCEYAPSDNCSYFVPGKCFSCVLHKLGDDSQCIDTFYPAGCENYKE